MKTSKDLVEKWFEKWRSGDFLNLPISDDFTHTSPYGTISGKQAYIDIVEANKEQFLGYEFTIHDSMFERDKACVRYTANHGDFILEVSEWYYIKDNLIHSIVAYYNIDSEIPEDRQLETPE